MLSFAAEFPVNQEKNIDDFLLVAKSWVLDSPHTEFCEQDISDMVASGYFKKQIGIQTVESLAVTTAVEELAAVRNSIKNKEFEWVTTATFSRMNNDAWVGIRLNVVSDRPVAQLPEAKKPVLVRYILNKLGGDMDCGLCPPVLPQFLSNSDVGLAAGIIRGEISNYLPVVYISSNFDGKYALDPSSLASDLSGMAHVLVEPNRPFSIRLSIDVNSENVYGGRIGLYWPDGTNRKTFYFDDETRKPAELKKAIISEVQRALLTRRPLQRCTWSHVQEEASKMAYASLKNSGSNEVKRYVDAFDSEIRAKEESLEDAEREINRLKLEIRKYAKKSSDAPGVCIETGYERDFYAEERLSIIIGSFIEGVDRAQADSRRRHVLQSVIDSNRVSDHLSYLRNLLKEMLRDYRNMDRKTRDNLEKIGFSIHEEGKHYKLIYMNDDRYTFALPKSGSDHRGGLNSASDIAKRIF